MWTDRHKNPGHLGHRDTENADKNVNSTKERRKKKEERRKQDKQSPQMRGD